MPITVSRGGQPPPRPEQFALLESQRRWVAGMVAQGHQGHGWFRLKERALTMHQRSKVKAIDPEAVLEIGSDLSQLLQRLKLANWGQQLAEVGITTLLALRSVAADHELPQGMPPLARRVLMKESRSHPPEAEMFYPPPRHPANANYPMYTTYPAQHSDPHDHTPHIHPSSKGSSPAATPSQSPSLNPHLYSNPHAVVLPHVGNSQNPFTQNAPYQQQPGDIPHIPDPNEVLQQQQQQQQQHLSSPPVSFAGSPSLSQTHSVSRNRYLAIDGIELKKPPQNQAADSLYENIDLKEANPGATPELVCCGVMNCRRMFAADRIEKHRKICAKQTGDRVPFKVNRTPAHEGEPLTSTATTPAEKPAEKKSNWRAKSKAFQAVVKGQPTPEDVDDRVQCPTCGKKFNPQTATAHMPGCADRERKKPKQNPKTPNRTATAKTTAAPPPGKQAGRVAKESQSTSAQKDPFHSFLRQSHASSAF
ncbi:hypothetical protein DIPPA_59826 [Diplonema papillatum]|nr:hypothetical protein DIPPA_59826 [Diplonema papillatum]